MSYTVALCVLYLFDLYAVADVNNRLPRVFERRKFQFSKRVKREGFGEFKNKENRQR